MNLRLARMIQGESLQQGFDLGSEFNRLVSDHKLPHPGFWYYCKINESSLTPGVAFPH
jgi:hypothetical protein